MASSPLRELSKLGQSVWIDDLNRKGLQDGTFQRLIDEDSVVGLTSNPTIFEKAMAEGDHYDDQLAEVARTTDDPKEIFLTLAVKDVQDACDLLRPVFDSEDGETGRIAGQDGYVSLEVDPTLAHEREATLNEARRIKELVDRPNLLVKIPATEEGLPAIEDAIAEGISVNVTLIFSLMRHREVIEAYVRGLERLVESGGDPSKVASVASFFISRVDTEADKRLEEAGKPELKGRLAIANAKLAYQSQLERFGADDDRWPALEAKGATVQRCLWASTSTKDPSYKDTLYVEELIGDKTVNTMPGATIEAFQDHGEVRGRTVVDDVEEAKQVFEEVAAAGVDYDDVSATIEREGVEKFAASFASLIEGVDRKRGALAGQA